MLTFPTPKLTRIVPIKIVAPVRHNKVPAPNAFTACSAGLKSVSRTRFLVKNGTGGAFLSVLRIVKPSPIVKASEEDQNRNLERGSPSSRSRIGFREIGS